MAEWGLNYKVDIWTYCLMPNHIHLITVPETKDGLNLAVGEAHRRYTRMINLREGWRGHLWQGRFASFIMEESYLLACTRYIEYNPVRAGLVKHPEDWKWSSAGAHMDEKDDILVKTRPLLEIINTSWVDFLSSDIKESEIELFRCDDMTFSGKHFSDHFKTKVKHIIEECGFPLNPDKENAVAHHGPQTVVGLTVNRKKPLIPRAVRRHWRQERHIFEKYEIRLLDEKLIEQKQNRVNGQKGYLKYISTG